MQIDWYGVGFCVFAVGAMGTFIYFLKKGKIGKARPVAPKK